MNVELPTTGCNIINSSTSFYNYSSDYKTRQTYIIFDGVPHLQSEQYNNIGYTVTGECLHTGDLVYRPEMEFWYNIFATILGFFVIIIISKILLRKWWRTLK